MNTSIPLTKTCSKCGEEYPATPEYWHRKKSGKYGLCAQCKVCLCDKSRQWYMNNTDRARESIRQYRANHLGEDRNRSRQYAANHAEQARERARQWRQKHMEQHREYSLQYRASHLEERREYEIQWQKDNPDKVSARSSRRRARKMNAEGSYTADDMKAQYKRQKGRCFYCGEKLNGVYHDEHVVPLSRGGSNYPSNMVCACPDCNRRKHNKLLHEWDGTDKLL